MGKAKKIFAFFAAAATAASVPCYSFADNMVMEIFPEAESSHITIYTDKQTSVISKYIFGVADKGTLYKNKPTVIKQTGTALSSYNWETNYSNSGAAGMNMNDVSLVSGYPAAKWSSPALFTDKLMSISSSERINVRLATLQMMGYAAKDSLGIVSGDEDRLSRFNTVLFPKNDTYLNQPDTTDDYVYTDEYVSYLVNRFGTASEGGINGYFLDNEPDLWVENFPALGLERITPEELVKRSAELAESVKTIDSKAFIFGPSLGGLQGCINLNNPDARSSASSSEYTWFIDYYLAEMRKQSEQRNVRLLDVLDIHYFTNATTPVGTEVLTADDDYSNAYRMQAVRTLWDSDYTENSVTVLMNKQFTPVLPTLNASLRLNYPGTRLSVSEYDFGGGGNMSGAIAQVDVLGTFASENVYLACLCPKSEDSSFQEAALRLFTDYDGNGSRFNRNLLSCDNDDKVMSSVYAAADDDMDTIHVILTNKNMVKDRQFTVDIDSSFHSYSLSAAYTIDSDSAEIIPVDIETFDTDPDSLELTAETMSVYMLVLSADVSEDEPHSGYESIWQTSLPPYEEPDSPKSSDTSGAVTSIPESALHSDTQTSVGSSYENPAYETMPDIGDEVTSSVTQVSSSATVSETVSESSTTVISEVSEPAADDDNENDRDRAVAMPVKVLVTMLAVAAAGGIVYILFFDRK